MLDVVSGPHLVDAWAAPFNPVVEGQVGRVVDAVFLLQRRPDNTTAATGNDGRATWLGGHFEGNRPCAGVAGIDSSRDAGTARTNNRDVGFIVFDFNHC